MIDNVETFETLIARLVDTYQPRLVLRAIARVCINKAVAESTLAGGDYTSDVYNWQYAARRCEDAAVIIERNTTLA